MTLSLSDFPLEILRQVFSNFTPSEKRHFCMKLPISCKEQDLVRAMLYEKVKIGIPATPNDDHHLLVKKEIRNLANGNIRAFVSLLRMNVRYFPTDFALPLLESISDYFDKIPNVEIEGSNEDVDIYAKRMSVYSVVKLNLTGGNCCVGGDYSNLEHLKFCFEGSKPQTRFPLMLCSKSLSTIEIQGKRKLKLSQQPTFRYDWKFLPAKIMKLKFENCRVVLCTNLPKLLTHLVLVNCTLSDPELLLSNLSPQLKHVELDIGSIQSLADIQFPPSLEFFKVSNSEISDFHSVHLPIFLNLFISRTMTSSTFILSSYQT